MDEQQKPPLKERLKKSMVFIGPGLLLAITAAGETGIADGLEIGAHYGLALVWIVVLTLLFKYAFTVGIARYTLATKETIFSAMPKIPGPKNWASYFTIFAYIVESAVIGSMVIFAATFLDYLIPGTFPLILIELIIVVLAFLVLRTHIYHHFEMIMAAIVILLSAGMVIFLFSYPSVSAGLLPGLVPTIPHGSETIILCILGVVGSGLTLMLYSVWLEKKIRAYNEKSENIPLVPQTSTGLKKFFKLYLNNVRVDIIFGFILVAIITIGAMAIGYLGYHSSFIPADQELNVDLLISMILNLLQDYPGISYILLGLFVALFFGAIVIGLDARATAITKVIKAMRKSEGKNLKNPSLVYNLCLVGFLLLVIAGMVYNKPLEVLVNISMFCAIFFGIYGFIMIYLNNKLPKFARGSRLWMLIIGIGSAVSIVVALLIEHSILQYGIPLIQKLALVLVVIFLLCKSKMFKRLAEGTSTVIDKIWLVVILGAVAIASTISGVGSIEYGDGLFITFRDMAPIIAGIIGGPIIGGIVGIIGGIAILVGGGTASVLGCIGTIIAGILAGFAIRAWKGKLSLLRSILIGLGIECLLLLSLLPTYLMISGITATLTLEIVLTIAPSMIFAVALGVVCFWLFTREYPVYKSSMEKFSMKRIINDFKDLKSADTEEIVETEEKK